ncbi:MAG: ABC transporter permease [Gemmatimonadaceae bacterium]
MMIDRLLTIIPLRLRTLFRRDEVERDLEDELLDHIERETAENIRRGLTPHAARLAARRALGNIELQKENVRDTRGTRGFEEFARDARFALRSLRLARGFASAVVITLALGIGANTAMFALLRGTLLRPLPNRDGDRLVYLRQSADGAGRENVLFSVPEIADLKSSTKSLASVAEYSSALPFTLAGSDGVQVRVRAGVISGNYFDVMGLEPVLGRLTNTRDDGPTAVSVVVLTHQYWMEHFGGDSGVIGHSVRLNDRVATIVGVVQPAPHFPRRTELFTNMVTSPHHLSATMVTERTHRMTELFGRLTPTGTVDQLRTETRRLMASMMRDHPESYDKVSQHLLTVSPLRSVLNERASLTFWLLMGAAGFVLLIACANVSNLTLMRGVRREREMLVRTALGAGTARLRRLLLVENLTLALLGGALGVLVAIAGTKLLVAFAAQLSPRAAEIRVDGVVLAVGLVTSVLAAIALSYVPRLGGERALAASLAPSGRRSTLGHGRKRFQQSLVVAQVAVSLVLLTGAGLLVRTLTKVQSVETGVRVEHVLTFDLPLGGDLLKEVMKQPENLARYERIRDRVAALPGVEAVALGSGAPLRSTLLDFDVKAEGRALAPNQPMPHPSIRMVDPQYFSTAGIPLIKGRDFESTDLRGAARVVMLNRAAARQLFGDDDPIGQRVALTGAVLKFTPLSGDWQTVVGLVGDTRDNGLDAELTPTMFEPFAQELVLGGALLVRTGPDPDALRATIMRTIRDVHPRQLIENVATLEQIRDEHVAPRRLNAIFVASFATLALLIAMVGIAGVLAFSVASRTPEIGIRLSLGASAGRVHRMVLSEGGALLAIGLIFGLAGALVGARVLGGLLFGVSPQDPATIGSVALVLSLVGLAACWIPAARAARVDPTVALRAD